MVAGGSATLTGSITGAADATGLPTALTVS